MAPIECRSVHGHAKFTAGLQICAAIFFDEIYCILYGRDTIDSFHLCQFVLLRQGKCSLFTQKIREKLGGEKNRGNASPHFQSQTPTGHQRQTVLYLFHSLGKLTGT